MCIKMPGTLSIDILVSVVIYSVLYEPCSGINFYKKAFDFLFHHFSDTLVILWHVL